MATQASRTTPSNSSPAAQGSPRIRDLSGLRNGEPGSAFRGIGRGRGGRGYRGRGGRSLGSTAHAESREGRPHPDTVAPQTEAPSNAKALVPTSVPDKPTGPPDRGAKSKATSRRSSRPTPQVVIIPPPPHAETSPVTPSSASRHPNRKRRSQQQSKTPSDRNSKPLSSQAPSKPSRDRKNSAHSPAAMRKDVPPHQAAAHEAEVRHDIEALVERVRAVAMAENRPITPGSHIDWAGEEDDSLPDLDDWGVTTTNPTVNGEGDEDISPILGDALKQLPEPHSDIEHEATYNQEMETYDDAQANEELKDLAQTPSLTDLTQTDNFIAPNSEHASDAGTSEVFSGSSSVPPAVDIKAPVCPPLHPHSEASTGKETDPPLKSSELTTDEGYISTVEGASGSIHAPSSRELTVVETRSRSCSSERGLSASIHAPAGQLESRSAPNLLPDHSAPAKNHSFTRSHGRSHTESRPGQPPRSSRSGASSPLGQHVYSHSRNHSTPPTGGINNRPHHTSRPVITGEAISRLARTIGGLGQVPRTQGIPVVNDSPVIS